MDVSEPFRVAFRLDTPHGVVVGVAIPDGPDPVPEAVLARLPDAEATHARARRGYAQVQFAGGRLALREACAAAGLEAPPLLATDRGAPALPPGWAGSVSHKRTLAVALAARAPAATLGVDLEDLSPPRPTIARHVLTDAEAAVLAPLSDAERWRELILRFSVKEAVYKALDPYVRRYIAFREAEVTPGGDGAADVRLLLARGEGPFAVEARHHQLGERILTTVRARRITDAGRG